MTIINNHKVIVIVGPTASGKSDVANNLAYRINGEVISADSMQIYKNMNIGTGKITVHDQKVKHWGIDLIEPCDTYSVSLYQDYSRKRIKQINQNNKIAVLCGGTGFYVRAAIDNYIFPKGKQKNNLIRNKYENYLRINGKNKLWELLNKKDSKSAQLIHKNNTVRIIRALEILEEGKCYFDQVNKLKDIKQKIPAIFFGLNVSPDILRKRIDYRVNKMIENGLISEVKYLLNNGYRKAITAAGAIGYKEIVNYLDNNYSLDEAINKIKIATHQYAKRQRTWFRKDKRINWIDYDIVDADNAVEYIIWYCDRAQ